MDVCVDRFLFEEKPYFINNSEESKEIEI